MFKPIAFANAFALTTAILYLAFYTLQIIAPPFFKLAVNSQLMGADLVSLIPGPNITNFLGVMIAVLLLSWIFGYLLARIYNRLTVK
jgi:hypothetical protein